VSRSKSNLQILRERCEFYAQKYNYKPDNVERGLEGYATHLFAQEDGFDVVLEGQPTEDVDLQDFICRDHDLGIDAVLEDESNKRLILVQATWRKQLDEDKVATFFDAPSRRISPQYRATGGEHIQELLAGFDDKLRDGYEVSLRFVNNQPVADKNRLQDLMEARNLAYEEADRPIVCELYGAPELIRHEEELNSVYTADSCRR
jgi:hypothetical protein